MTSSGEIHLYSFGRECFAVFRVVFQRRETIYLSETSAVGGPQGMVNTQASRQIIVAKL